MIILKPVQVTEIIYAIMKVKRQNFLRHIGHKHNPFLRPILVIYFIALLVPQEFTATLILCSIQHHNMKAHWGAEV